MEEMNSLSENEEERRVRRAQRMAEMRRSKEQQRRRREFIKRITPFVIGGISILLVCVVAGRFVHRRAATEPKENSVQENSLQPDTQKSSTIEGTQAVHSSINSFLQTGQEATAAGTWKPGGAVFFASATEDTVLLGEEIVSGNAVLIDLSTNEIVASKAENQRINPASMTKVLTLLVAAEHVEDLDDTFTITIDITDYSYVNDCSNVGFAKDETVTVRDLLYGTILPSGADAAVGLATYVAGSQEEFVAMMNEKLKELGLSDTAHFTNCVGLYDENHYCTVYDMAVILKAAIDNELCKEVLSAHTYTTSKTKEHPEGITISNWFLRRIEDKDSGGEVVCGKTGYVVQSGNCAASYAVSKSGKGYICVTADATSGWKCIYDHVALYKNYMK